MFKKKMVSAASLKESSSNPKEISRGKKTRNKKTISRPTE
jgi:hypothetical protein